MKNILVIKQYVNLADYETAQGNCVTNDHQMCHFALLILPVVWNTSAEECLSQGRPSITENSTCFLSHSLR